VAIREKPWPNFVLRREIRRNIQHQLRGAAGICIRFAIMIRHYRQIGSPVRPGSVAELLNVESLRHFENLVPDQAVQRRRE
jgi:hypothetical protein